MGQLKGWEENDRTEEADNEDRRVMESFLLQAEVADSNQKMRPGNSKGMSIECSHWEGQGAEHPQPYL